MGDENLADEMMHLGAMPPFAIFHGVVVRMQCVSCNILKNNVDSDGPKLPIHFMNTFSETAILPR
jgi:hypothetical protein